MPVSERRRKHTRLDASKGVVRDEFGLFHLPATEHSRLLRKLADIAQVVFYAKDGQTFEEWNCQNFLEREPNELGKSILRSIWDQRDPFSPNNPAVPSVSEIVSKSGCRFSPQVVENLLHGWNEVFHDENVRIQHRDSPAVRRLGTDLPLAWSIYLRHGMRPLFESPMIKRSREEFNTLLQSWPDSPFAIEFVHDAKMFALEAYRLASAIESQYLAQLEAGKDNAAAKWMAQVWLYWLYETDSPLLESELQRLNPGVGARGTSARTKANWATSKVFEFLRIADGVFGRLTLQDWSKDVDSTPDFAGSSLLQTNFAPFVFYYNRGSLQSWFDSD